MLKSRKSYLTTIIIQAIFFLAGLLPILHYTYPNPVLDDPTGESLIAPLIKRYSLYSAIGSEHFNTYYSIFLIGAIVCGVLLIGLAVFSLLTGRDTFLPSKLLNAAQIIFFGVPLWFTGTLGAILFCLLIINLGQLTLYEKHWQKTSALKVFNAVLWIAMIVIWFVLMLVGFGFFPIM